MFSHRRCKLLSRNKGRSIVDPTIVRMQFPKSLTYDQARLVVRAWLAEHKLAAMMWDCGGSVGVKFYQPVRQAQIRHSAPYMPMPWNPLAVLKRGR